MEKYTNIRKSAALNMNAENNFSLRLFMNPLHTIQLNMPIHEFILAHRMVFH